MTLSLTLEKSNHIFQYSFGYRIWPNYMFIFSKVDIRYFQELNVCYSNLFHLLSNSQVLCVNW